MEFRKNCLFFFFLWMHPFPFFFFLRRTFAFGPGYTHIHSGFGGVRSFGGWVSTATQLSRNKMGGGGEFLSKCYVPNSDWEFLLF